MNEKKKTKLKYLFDTPNLDLFFGVAERLGPRAVLSYNVNI